MNCSKIKLVILDVDGTLTDGGIYYDAQGNELKRFDVKDGLAIKVAIEAGLQFAIITGRVSPMVERRAKELGIQHLKTGVQVKYPAMVQLLDTLGILPWETCYIGDDWNDLQCMQNVGLRMCPGDAAEEVKEVCHFVSIHSGGCGAVRECIQALLIGQKKWRKNCEKAYVAE